MDGDRHARTEAHDRGAVRSNARPCVAVSAHGRPRTPGRRSTAPGVKCRMSIRPNGPAASEYVGPSSCGRSAVTGLACAETRGHNSTLETTRAPFENGPYRVPHIAHQAQRGGVPPNAGRMALLSPGSHRWWRWPPAGDSVAAGGHVLVTTDTAALEPLAVPLVGGDVAWMDAVEQGSCLVDDHFFVDSARHQLILQGVTAVGGRWW